MEELYCPECGTKNLVGNTFCMECGHPLSVVVKSVAEIPPVEQHTIKQDTIAVSQLEEHHEKKKKHKKGVAIGSAAALIVLAGGGVGYTVVHQNQVRTQQASQAAKTKASKEQAAKEKAEQEAAEKASQEKAAYAKLMSDATDKVSKAESSKSDNDISSAQAAISLLDASDQTDLTQRINKVISDAAAEKATAASKAAEQAATPTLKSKYQDSEGNIYYFKVEPAGEATGIYRFDSLNDDGTYNMGQWRPFKLDDNYIFDSSNDVDIDHGESLADATFNYSLEGQKASGFGLIVSDDGNTITNSNPDGDEVYTSVSE